MCTITCIFISYAFENIDSRFCHGTPETHAHGCRQIAKKCARTECCYLLQANRYTVCLRLLFILEVIREQLALTVQTLGHNVESDRCFELWPYCACPGEVSPVLSLPVFCDAGIFSTKWRWPSVTSRWWMTRASRWSCHYAWTMTRWLTLWLSISAVTPTTCSSSKVRGEWFPCGLWLLPLPSPLIRDASDVFTLTDPCGGDVELG